MLACESQYFGWTPLGSQIDVFLFLIVVEVGPSRGFVVPSDTRFTRELGNSHQSGFPERYSLSFCRRHELFENPVPKLCRHSSQGGQSRELVFATLCAAIRMMRWALNWCLSFQHGKLSSYVIWRLEEDGCKIEVDWVRRVLSRWYALIWSQKQILFPSPISSIYHVFEVSIERKSTVCIISNTCFTFFSFW